MDLLQTVRKSGSRGGVNFSWDDVKSSQHRENYLGHSLMAPVGRWQKNKDLSWYSKAEDADLSPEDREEKRKLELQEEKRRMKEAEEDAMARALGLPMPDRRNANLEPLGLDRNKHQALNEALKGGDEQVQEKKERHENSRRRRHRSRSGSAIGGVIGRRMRRGPAA
ncbi:Kinase phosphorylation protein [Teratosphaeria destructans]|uniref:Kinase phosphorylation protein n=1 Tax=Teratosphaeria destructans TaxID=418781 RepID=A0A9W7SYH2_9PEZI|nr:Kinase phosphorylation protein [Teratosphaeria destructans]